MAFAVQLEDSLRHRESLASMELAAGEELSTVLGRYLLAVEAAAETDMLTSILLLDGNRLRHGAAPNLPPAYCAAIDGTQIGPDAGSCGTAAYRRIPIYVTDTATDPLWADYRDLAADHGLRACWSTPIFNEDQSVIGTFAIYHLSARSPTREEVQAIATITEHVARAITWSTAAHGSSIAQVPPAAPVRESLRLVASADEIQLPMFRLARDFDALIDWIDAVLASLAVSDPHSVCIGPLQRARTAAEKGRTLARSSAPND
jgi:hypothetical protein